MQIILNLLKGLFRLTRNLLALFGGVCLIFGLLYGVKVYRTSALPPRQFAVKVVNKLGMNSPFLEKIISASPRFPEYQFLGEFKNDLFPRTIFGGPTLLAKLRARYREDDAFRRQVDGVGKSGNPMNCAVAWACSGQEQYQQAGLRALESQEVTSPLEEDGREGNGWLMALAYDLLRDSPETRLPQFEIRLQDYVRKTLLILDEDSASLWHARFTLASSAWLAAAVLDDGDPQTRDLMRQAQAHYLQAVLALEVTEGWPEGYTYWINNRAFVYLLASLAHMHSIEEPALNDRILKTIERVGLWTIHGTEPTGRFVLFGDTGPRNDLKYDTQRVVDLMFLATGNPVFSGFSEYLSTLFTTETYDPPYRWGLPLFQGIARNNGVTPRPSLQFLDGVLPTAELFGRDSFGQAFIRSDWSPEATFIGFRAGHSFTHHGHYQAGHFTLFKDEPLAITSGTYGGWTSPHRLDYYLRTVASNSLLVLRPGEKVQPNRFFQLNVADGGQRVVMPTGSANVSVADWRKNLDNGWHYEGGRITAFENREPMFTYLAADLTGAYNNTVYDDNGKGGKVSRVTRQLLYLRGEDLLLVHDRVAATDGGFVKKWLLHSFLKPQSAQEKILVGSADNGILESTDELIAIPGKKASLTVHKLLPRDGVIRKVGGPGYRYYVETDGDEAVLDGRNLVEGAAEKPWFDSGMWRLEIQPTAGRKADSFLVLLKPGAFATPPVRLGELLVATGGDGVETPKSVAFFVNNADDQSFAYQVSAGHRRHHLLGLAPKREFQIVSDEQLFTMWSSAEGGLAFDLGREKPGQVLVRPL